MFEPEKQDPIKIEITKEEEEIIVSDYLQYEKGEILQTEAYYVTKVATVKGMLRFMKDYLKFEAADISENDHVRHSLIIVMQVTE